MGEGIYPSVSTTPAFWERLWRSAGIQSFACFIVAYAIYGAQPAVGASADVLTAFYSGDRTRILIAAIFFGLAVLNLLWFAARSGPPWKTRVKTAGARPRPLPAQCWEGCSSCSSR